MPWYRLPKSGEAMWRPGRLHGLEEVPDPTVPVAAGPEPPAPEPEPAKTKRKRGRT